MTRPKMPFFLVPLAWLWCFAYAAFGATSETRYGITWTWTEDRAVGTFANGDPWVVGPITLTSITPQTAIIDGRQANGSMINPVPTLYAPQGFDASIITDYNDVPWETKYSESLNIALVGGSPISVSNTRVVPAGSSICSVISTFTADRDPETRPIPGIREAFTDFAVLTVLASAPASGSFRPPYTIADKTIRWNKSQLNYEIFRDLAPVAGQSAPTGAAFTRPWVEIEMNYNQSRHWHPPNNQVGYDRDMADAVGNLILELNTNYTNAQKETAYIRLVQYGIDVYGQLKDSVWNINGTDYPAPQENSQTKPALIIAALALNDADLKTYVDGPEFKPLPWAWSPLGVPRFYADNQIWYVGDVNNSDDVGRTLDPGNQQYVAGDVGNPEWGPEHWGDRDKDSAAWGKAYRNVRYVGQVSLALGMQLTIGARELWNNQVYFDYYDRARALYRVDGNPGADDGSGVVVPLVWEAYRSLGGPIWTGTGGGGGTTGTLTTGTLNVGTLNIGN